MRVLDVVISTSAASISDRMLISSDKSKAPLRWPLINDVLVWVWLRIVNF